MPKYSTQKIISLFLKHTLVFPSKYICLATIPRTIPQQQKKMQTCIFIVKTKNTFLDYRYLINMAHTYIV